MVAPCLHGPGGGGIGEKLDPGMTFQAPDGRGMVAVLVGEKNGVDPGERFADAGQEVFEPPDGKSGVHQHPGLLRHQKGAIARTAAAENAKPHGHGWLQAKRSGGKSATAIARGLIFPYCQ